MKQLPSPQAGATGPSGPKPDERCPSRESGSPETQRSSPVPWDPAGVGIHLYSCLRRNDTGFTFILLKCYTKTKTSPRGRRHNTFRPPHHGFTRVVPAKVGADLTGRCLLWWFILLKCYPNGHQTGISGPGHRRGLPRIRRHFSSRPMEANWYPFLLAENGFLRRWSTGGQLAACRIAPPTCPKAQKRRHKHRPNHQRI